MSPVDSRNGRRPPLVGAAVVLLMVVAVGCGDGAAGDATTTLGSATTTLGSATTVTVVASTAPMPAPERLLTDAIFAVGAAYRYEATVTVAGEITTTVSGRRQADLAQYSVITGGATVEYLIGPGGQFAREAGGVWSVLASPAPVGDPLAPLANPTRVTLVTGTGADAELEAVYPAAALGATTGDTIVVRITIRGGLLAAMAYEVDLNAGGVSSVAVVIAPDPDTTPITYP